MLEQVKNKQSLSVSYSEHIVKTSLSLILLTCTILLTQIKAEEQPLIGIHGMVIFNQQGQWYASHLPLANSIHSHQIVFSFEFEGIDKAVAQEFKRLATQQELVTVVPEPFDLRQLTTNSMKHFQAKVYRGHFERGGAIISEPIRIKVKQIHLNKMLSENKNGHYYTIRTSTNAGLLVHRIGASPSFDQILGFKLEATQRPELVIPKTINLFNKKPLQQLESDNQLLNITTQFYLETKDFE